LFTENPTFLHSLGRKLPLINGGSEQNQKAG
jgi:hypothetical protein